MGKLNWRVLVPLFLIFCLFVYLRFYDLGHRAEFGWDQDQFSNQIVKLVEDHQPSLLGPRVNNDNGFFLAPYFTYILVPFYLLTGLHPVGMFLFQFFANTGFFFLAFFVISKLFSHRHALFFLFLWTISYILMDLETITWWPILIPPGVMLLWFLQEKIYKNPKDFKLWILTGVISGLFINMHFQFIFTLIQFGFFALLLKTKKIQTTITNIAIFLTYFVLMFIPLFIFDLRNNFLNTKLFFNYFFIKNSIQSAQYFDWPLVFSLALNPYLIVKTPFAGIVTMVGLFCATFYLYRKSSGFKSLFYLTNSIMILITPVAFSLIGMRPSEYYFLYLMPIFLLVLIDLFLITKLSQILLGLCILLAVFNYPNLKLTLEPNYGSLQYKDDLVKYIKSQVGNKKFFISFDGPPGSDGGFRYLIKIHKLNSSPDGRNPQIQVKSPSLDGKLTYGIYGVIIPEELKR